MAKRRRKRFLLPVLGGLLVAASLVVAVSLTVGPTPADRLAEARALFDAGDLDASESILAAFESANADERAEAAALLSRIRDLRREGFDERRGAIALANARRARDEMTPQGFLSNNAGGILGGISSGQEIVASIALKPTSSMRIPGRSVDIDGNPVEVITTGRHDPCVGIRATPIAEAMMAIVLMDHLLRHRAQNHDVASRTPVIPGSV